MKRKLFALLLAAVLVVSLAACGRSNSDTSSAKDEGKKKTEESTKDIPEEPADGYDLDTENVYDLYVAWPSAGGAPADIELIEKEINAKYGKKLGVNVILSPISVSDLTSQEKLLISSGGNLDLVCMLWTGLDTWVNSESVLELEDYIEEYGTGITSALGESVSASMYNGHLYGIPTERSGYAYGFLANTDMLEKYGYDPEDHAITIDELEEMFETINAGEGDGYYMVAGSCAYQSINGRYDTAGGSLYTGIVDMNGDTTKIVNPYETDSFKEYANRVYDWAQKGYIPADAATNTDSRPVLLASGKYLGAFNYLTTGTKTGLGSSGTVPLTALELQSGYTTTDNLTSICWGVASTTEEPEKAVAFLSELYGDPELSRILTYGIEDVHYEVVDENEKGWKQVQMLNGLTTETSGYYVSYGVWEAGSNTVWASRYGYAMLEEKMIREGYEYSPAFGYSFNSTDYSVELTALSAVFNEYDKIINCGAVDPETELPAFINALKDAGIDDVIAANQAQYDEWLNSK